jgi:hypothetical protein
MRKSMGKSSILANGAFKINTLSCKTAFGHKTREFKIAPYFCFRIYKDVDF